MTDRYRARILSDEEIARARYFRRVVAVLDAVYVIALLLVIAGVVLFFVAIAQEEYHFQALFGMFAAACVAVGGLSLYTAIKTGENIQKMIWGNKGGK